MRTRASHFWAVKSQPLSQEGPAAQLGTLPPGSSKFWGILAALDWPSQLSLLAWGFLTEVLLTSRCQSGVPANPGFGASSTISCWFILREIREAGV